MARVVRGALRTMARIQSAAARLVIATAHAMARRSRRHSLTSASPLKPSLSRSVVELLHGIGDPETLQILLHLVRWPLRHWSSEQLAPVVSSSEVRRASLEKLAHLNLTDVRLGEDLLHRYAPATPELEATVTELVAECERRKEVVLDAIHAHRARS